MATLECAINSAVITLAAALLGFGVGGILGEAYGARRHEAMRPGSGPLSRR